MKNFFLFALIFLGFHAAPMYAVDGNESLGQSYLFTKRGLNYVTSSHRLGKRFFPRGVDQPAVFSVSGIPAHAVIEKAFMYASTSGSGVAVTLNITNPSSANFPIAATTIGSGADKCWGCPGSYAYRADVTEAITGNGDYSIAGWPATSTWAEDDTDGATLIIIFSDHKADYEGTVVINDGIMVSTGATVSTVISGYPTATSAVPVTTFVMIGDLQSNTNTVTMNGQSFIPTPAWWNFEARNSTVAVGQTAVNYTIYPPGECLAFVAAGLLYKKPHLYIDTSPIAGPLPRASSTDVAFTTTLPMNGANLFTAQLSDATGNFDTPVAIGTVAGTTSGSITATVPANIPVGTGYRIRVVGSDPALIGTDNGTDLQVILATPVAPDLVASSDTGGKDDDNVTSEQTPTLRGSAERGFLVRLYSGATEIGSATSDNTTGIWEITTSALSEGIHTLTAIVIDGSGTPSLSSDALTLTVDTTPPTAPSALDLADASDSGNDSDDITNDDSPTISGVAEAGATVKLFDGATEVGSATADAATGAWQLITSSLSDGARSLTAKAVDVAGNEGSASSVFEITIDTVKPDAPTDLDLAGTSDSGDDGDDITNDESPTITGTSEPGATVRLFDGSTEVGSALADATTGAWQIITSSLSDGARSLTAKAVDVAGNEGSPSSALEITIDTVKPDAPSDLDLAHASDSGHDADDLTNDDSPAITGTSEPGATVKLFDGTTAVGSTTSDITTGAWQIVTSSLSDGAHSLTAKAVDAAGNESSASSVLEITIDTVKPGAPSGLDLSEASDSGDDSDDITNDDSPTISGVAEAGATVRLFDGSTEVGSTTADATTGAWQIVTTSLSDGVRFLTAKAFDIAGNESPTSVVLEITLDTVIPNTPDMPDLVAASDSGNDADDITNDATPTVEGVAEPGSFIRLFDGGVELGSTVADAVVGIWQFTITTALANGAHALTVNATDRAGNESLSSAPLYITIDTVSPDAPGKPDLMAQSDTGRADDDDITRDPAPVITGVAEPGALVSLLESSDPIGAAMADPVTGIWEIVPSLLSNGTNIIAATATDAAGNQSHESVLLTIIIDTTPPSAPEALDLMEASDRGIESTDNITNDDTPMIDGVAESNAFVILYHGTAQVGSATADEVTGGWVITASPLSQGVITLTARATDTAGNESTDSPPLAITLDTSPPDAPSQPVLSLESDSGSFNDNITCDQTPLISGIAEPGALITIYNDDEQSGETPADATTGTWEFIMPLVTDGLYSLTVRATDVAGNVSAVSQPLGLTIDTVAPGLSVTSPDPDPVQGQFTVFFDTSEPVIDFAAEDIIVANGTASEFTQRGDLQYSVVITPTIPGAVVVAVHDNAFTDIAANGNLTASLSRQMDSPPTGYAIRFSTDYADHNNIDDISLLIEGAEVGATYSYSIVSSNGSEVLSGSGQVSAPDVALGSLGLASLADGVVTATIYLTDGNGNEGGPQSAALTKDVGDGEVIIYNSFSPNGDGMNDVWTLESLSFYNDVEVDVFDRAGVRVFHTTDPMRAWDGRNRHGIVLTGGYLYVVRIKDINLVKKGVLTVLK